MIQPLDGSVTGWTTQRCLSMALHQLGGQFQEGVPQGYVLVLVLFNVPKTWALPQDITLKMKTLK